MPGLISRGAGDGDALLLPAGEVGAARFDPAVVALRHLRDEFVGLRRFRRVNDFFVGGQGRAVGDVIAHAATEEDGLLHHHADAGAQSGRIPFAHIHAIYFHRTAADIVETRNQVDQSALAGTGRAQQRDLLPGIGAEANAVQDVVPADAIGTIGLARVAPAVVEGHILEADAPGDALGLVRTLARFSASARCQALPSPVRRRLRRGRTSSADCRGKAADPCRSSDNC